MYWIDLGTEVVVINFQVVPISQVVVKKGFTVCKRQGNIRVTVRKPSIYDDLYNKVVCLYAYMGICLYVLESYSVCTFISLITETLNIVFQISKGKC